MSKRLFALLLAAVLVLSMGAAQAPGQMSDTEQAEQGADVSVQTPDAADSAGDDTSAEETGGDDASSEETGGTGGDDASADETDETGGDDAPGDETGETGEDDGEIVPAAVNDMPVDDEPQTTADGPASVSVRFEGAEHIISLTADGQNVLSDAKAGTPIVLSADGDGCVTFGMELEEGYGAAVPEDSDDYIYSDAGTLYVYDEGDGAVTVRVVQLPKLVLTFAGETDRIESLTGADKTDYLSQARSGEQIVLFADLSGFLSPMNMELAAGCSVRIEYAEGTSSEPYYYYDEVSKQLRIDAEGREGAVTNVTVRVVSASKLTVIFQGADLIDSVTDVTGSTSYDFREPVELYPAGTNGTVLQITVKDGHYVQETGECYFESYYPSESHQRVELFRLNDRDGDGTVTVRVFKLVNVTLVDAGQYVTMVSDSTGPLFSGPFDGVYKIHQDGSLDLTAKACELDVEGGFVSGKHYRVDGANGELSVNYTVEPDGSGDMTVTTKAGDEAQMPKPIKIEYEGQVDQIKSKEDYVLPGGSFSMELETGYTISVEGSAFARSNSWGYSVYVKEDATFIKVTVAAVKTGAKLSVSVPEAVEPTDLYGESKDIEREYVGPGGMMADGQGWFMLKNGYGVGPGVTGGSVLLWATNYDEVTRSVHTYYTVDATADTVTVPIERVRPYRWVNVRVNGAAGCLCTVTSVLNVGDAIHTSGSGDYETLFPVLDELTATFITPGYELAAVSGCTLRWEKDEYGNITYRILPDAAGDTDVEVSVIEAGHHQPVLKVGTDADAGVQTDGGAENKLKTAISDAIDALAGGSVPAGMSPETADRLSAALEEADAVTVPEVSAVLSVKKADITAFPGAAAVYEIEIVICVNGKEVGRLTELSQPISISLPLPPGTGRIVYVIRAHQGDQERLAAAVKGGAIRFAADRFSEFAIMSSNDLADATVDPIPDQTWTGSELTPEVHVTITGPNGEETLKEGTDYKLIYRDNVKAGTAAVTIMGMGDFEGTSVTAEFQILEEKAEAATPPSDPDSTAGAPAASAPATGDETPLALYAVLLALGVSGLAAVLLRRKKQR